MLDFLNDSGRFLIPFENISIISWGSEKIELKDKLGNTHNLHREDWERIVRAETLGSFTAQPGTYVLDYFSDDEGEEITKSAVLGWRVCGDQQAIPVTLKTDLTEGENWAILYPDGRVENRNGGDWASEDEWVSFHRRPMPEHRSVAAELS